MTSPFWQFVAIASVAGFAVAIVLSFVARRLFVSKQEKEVRLGEQIISSLGGARNARSADEQLRKRGAER